MDTPKHCPSCGKPLAANAPAGLCPECLMQAGFPTGTEPIVGESKKYSFRPPSIEELKGHFPQLEILSFIGQGGMGAVYKARQPMLDRYVALKILPPEAATGPGFTERFTREARALARLNHPNIVAVHEFGRSRRGNESEDTGYHYLIMEYVDGVNLREMERAKRLSAPQALSIVPKICEALQYAHDEGVVHRDIKPENILVDKKGRVKIADFGIAKILGTESSVPLTGAQHVIGTPHYMAPEQVEKPQSVDHRADIYSLGVVFYEMLTGELPLGRFSAPSKKVQIDVRLDEVVLRALEKEPEQRYQQASVLKTDIETVASVPTPPASQPPPDDWLTKLQLHWQQLAKWGLIIFVFLDFALPHALGFGSGVRFGFSQPWLFLPHDGSGLMFNPRSTSFTSGIIAVAMALTLILTKRYKLTSRHRRWIAALTLTLAAFCAIRAAVRVVVAQQPKFHVGQSYFTGGDQIEITSVDRSRDEIIASGRYKLASTDRATLALNITSREHVTSREAPEQFIQISKGEGAFELRFPHPYPGMPHIAMYGSGGEPFANLYFGTKEEVSASNQLRLGLESSVVPASQADLTFAEMAAVVVETVPVSGSVNVEPGEREIKVRFSKEMTEDSWSWSSAWDNSTPQMIGEPHFTDARTCTLKVKLERGRTYAFWLNSEKFGNFKDVGGNPAVPYLLIFETKGK